MLTTLVSARILPRLWSSSRSGQLCGSVRLAYRSVPKRFLGRHQTTNLGVRSSNLFGRASFQHYPCESHGIHTASHDGTASAYHGRMPF
jgi:hypothetical protein